MKSDAIVMTRKLGSENKMNAISPPVKDFVAYIEIDIRS
jgi:hypothetical protein